MHRFAILGLLSAAWAQEWPSYGGDPGGSKYSPLKQIDRSNVATDQMATPAARTRLAP